MSPDSFPLAKARPSRRHVPPAPQRRMGDGDQRRHLRRQERRRVLAARRVHADLLVHAPAALQRTGAGVPRPGHRRDRLHLGQRPVRDGGVGQGPGSGERLPAARRQRRVHRQDGPAGRQVRPELRQALVALLDAGARPQDREDVPRAAGAGRPVQGFRRRHDAQVPEPGCEKARPGGDPDARRLLPSAPRPSAS